MTTNAISNTTEDAIMNLIFCATTWTDYAVSAGSGTPETNIVFALHSADPADAGTQTTSEIVYTSYARTNVARNNSTGFFASASGAILPRANVDFPAGTGGGPGPATFFSCGKSGGGASAILWRGDISPTITVGNGITPRLTTATSISID